MRARHLRPTPGTSRPATAPMTTAGAITNGSSTPIRRTTSGSRTVTWCSRPGVRWSPAACATVRSRPRGSPPRTSSSSSSDTSRRVSSHLSEMAPGRRSGAWARSSPRRRGHGRAKSISWRCTTPSPTTRRRISPCTGVMKGSRRPRSAHSRTAGTTIPRPGRSPNRWATTTTFSKQTGTRTGSSARLTASPISPGPSIRTRWRSSSASFS